MENISGVNDQKIDLLIKDIYSYYDRIREIFNEVENIMDSTSTFYKSETANLIRHEFQQYKDKFYIVGKNILSYADDMEKVKKNYANRVVEATTYLKVKGEERYGK